MASRAAAAFLEELKKQELIWTNEPGSFANDSYQERIPKLLYETAEYNKARLSTAQYERMVKLARDMQSNERLPLPMELLACDSDAATRPISQKWMQWLDGKQYTWQNAPWFLSELYAFHLVLVFSGYYDTKIDPFHPSKMAELNESAPWNLLQTAVQVSDTKEDRFALLQRLLKLCLWGNKADGCYKQVKDTISGVDATLAIEDKYLIIDHSDRVIAHLEQLDKASSSRHVQFINDNCGTELLLDLALVDHLLSHDWCNVVTFNVKHEPMYISDATPSDVDEHIGAMTQNNRSHEIQALGQRLTKYVENKQLKIVSDMVFNEYVYYYELPLHVADRLRQDAHLVILKGDLNYRRLVGDRLWPVTTPVKQAIPLFPTPFVSLRTLKSNPIVGIPAPVASQLDAEDPKWRFNGKRGIIQSNLTE